MVVLMTNLASQLCPCDEGCPDCGDTGFRARRRPGRPALADKRRPRGVKWRDAEWAAISAAAAEEGTPTAVWVRLVVAEALDRRRP